MAYPGSSSRLRRWRRDSLSAAPFLAALAAAKLDFAGTAAQLLGDLTPVDQRPPHGWPKNPRAVTGILKVNAPALRKAGWSVEHSEDSHTKVTDWTLIHPENVRNPQHPQHPQTAATASHAGVAGTYTGYLRMTSPRPTSTANALATGKPNCLAFNACVLADTGCHHHQDQKPTAAVPTAAASSSWRPPWGSALRVRRADVR
jgi:hypothetical protein